MSNIVVAGSVPEITKRQNRPSSLVIRIAESRDDSAMQRIREWLAMQSNERLRSGLGLSELEHRAPAQRQSSRVNRASRLVLIDWSRDTALRAIEMLDGTAIADIHTGA